MSADPAAAAALNDVVRAAWLAYLAHDHETAFAAIADDIRWTVPGDAPGVSGTHVGKQHMRDVGEIGRQLFPEGVAPVVHNVFGQGDLVAIEYTNHGKVYNGRVYENDYVVLFRVSGGKITEIREYYDTAKVQAVLYAPADGQ